METQKQIQLLQQRLEEARGVDNEMLTSLLGRILYIQESNPNSPNSAFSGRLESFGETFLKFVGVTIFTDGYGLSKLDEMRRDLAPNPPFKVTKISAPVYKNRNDIATLIDLYPSG